MLIDASNMGYLQYATLAVCTAALYFTKFSSYRLLFIVAALYGAIAFTGLNVI